MGRKKKEVSTPAGEVPDLGYVEVSKTTDKSLELIKTKLRKKYYLLKNEALDFDSRERLLEFVCKTLGVNKPTLDSVLSDL